MPSQEHDQRLGLRHIPGLDGLRGVAVAGVVLYHLGHLRGGYLGVDAFFVLSGFLITSLLLSEWDRWRHVGLRNFWARRARRLLPGLFGLLLGIAAYAAWFAAPTELNQIRGDAFATLGYVANWRAVWVGQSYFAQFSAPSPLEHAWSLAIEEQFYVLWPLVVVAVMTWRRGSLRAMFVTALGLALASELWMVVRYSPGADPSRVYFGTDTRVGSILLGAALAVWLAWRGPVRTRAGRRWLEAAAWVAVAVLGLAWLRLDGQSDTLYRVGFFVCACALVVVIAAVAHPSYGVIGRILSVRPLTLLGLISYGVYLWHWPMDLVLTPSRTGLDGLALDVTRVGATLLVATASFVLVERPIRHGLLKRLGLWTWVPIGAAGAAAAVFVGTLGAVASPGQAVTSSVAASSRLGSHTRRVLVLGDSVAGSVAAGLVAHHAPWSVQVVDQTLVGCAFIPTDEPVRDLGGGLMTGPLKRVMEQYRKVRCDARWKQTVRAFHPAAVVITVGSDDALRRRNTPCSARYGAQYTSRLSSDVAALEALGTKVELTTTAYPRPPFIRIPNVTEVYRRVDCKNALDRQVARTTHAALVDVNFLVCRGDPASCAMRLGGTVLRPDGIHYAPDAAKMLGPVMLAQALGRA